MTTTATTTTDDVHYLSECVKACLARVEELEQQHAEDVRWATQQAELIESLADTVTRLAQSTAGTRRVAAVERQLAELARKVGN